MIEIASEWMAVLVHLAASSALVGAIVAFDRWCPTLDGQLVEECDCDA